jgi:hypothetical protein
VFVAATHAARGARAAGRRDEPEPPARDRGQGTAAAAPRPAHLRDDPRHPDLQLLLFGFAINLDIRHIDAAIVDQARTAHRARSPRRSRRPGCSRCRTAGATPGSLQALIRKGRISIGIVIPPTSTARLATARPPRGAGDGGRLRADGAGGGAADRGAPLPGVKPATRASRW